MKQTKTSFPKRVELGVGSVIKNICCEGPGFHSQQQYEDSTPPWAPYTHMGHKTYMQVKHSYI